MRIVKVCLTQTLLISGRRLPENPAELKLFLDGWISDLVDIPSRDLPEMFRRARIRTEFFTSRAVVAEWEREIELRRDALRIQPIALGSAPPARRIPSGDGQKISVSLPAGRTCSFTVRIFEETRGASSRRMASFSEGEVDSGEVSGDSQEFQAAFRSGGVVRAAATCPVHGSFEARVLLLGKSAHLSGCPGCSTESGKRPDREYFRQSDGKMYVRTIRRFEQNEHGKKTTYVGYSEWEECPVC
ncbi:MAG: hypothetical protein M0041_01620 [Nitrospiraceae bacterium]|nr:hypothetical protein [Nitrospiraceae bacterium]